MRTATDPFAANTESLATSGAGELERLRYTIANALGWAYFYSNDTNINFAHAGGKTNVQGSGSGRHVTAVGYHSWAGSARFPAIAGRYVHTTGLFWPAAHHVAIAVDPAVERDKGGVEVLRLHFEALTLHHTVALRYAHSNAGLAAWQYPHITALQVRRPQQAPDGTTPFTADISDQIIVGHRGVALQLQGASLIPAANRLVGYGPSGDYVEAKTISGSLTITHQAGQLVFGSSAATTLWASRGQFSGTGGTADGGHVFTLRAHLLQLMNASTHALTVRVAPAAVSVDIGDATGSANGAVNEASPNGRDRKATLNADTWVHFYWIWHSGSSLLRGVASPNVPTTGPNLPQGFESWAYAGAVRRGPLVASPLLGTHILGTMAMYHSAQSVLVDGVATAETVIDLSSVVPPNAVQVLLNGTARAGGRNLILKILTGTPFFFGEHPAAADLDSILTFQVLMPNISERIYYDFGTAPGATSGLYLDANGYRLPNGGD